MPPPGVAVIIDIVFIYIFPHIDAFRRARSRCQARECERVRERELERVSERDREC